MSSLMQHPEASLPLCQPTPPQPTPPPAAWFRDEGSVSLFMEDDGVVLVVLHGVIGYGLQQDVRDLVDDLVTDVAATAHRPVRVLAENVTSLELPGVWLLLELRRAARPATVTLVRPSPAVREALGLHGIMGLVLEG